MSDSEATQRLFFALWPPPEVQGALARRAREALDGRRARLVPQENVHLTLAFLGEVDAGVREGAESVARTVRSRAFNLTLDRLGYWARRGLLWAGPAHPPAEVADLADGLGRGLSEVCGLERERRTFRPHLTLARKAPKLPSRTVIEPVEWPVERFVLVASELDHGGPAYSIVAEWTLAQAGDPDS